MPSKKIAPAKKPTKITKQGQRAPDKTQTSISLSISSLERARVQAKADGRSLSNWIEQLIRAKHDAS